MARKMWTADSDDVRSVTVEVYGHPANNVWIDPITKKRYDEYDTIFATEKWALESRILYWLSQEQHAMACRMALHQRLNAKRV